MRQKVWLLMNRPLFLFAVPLVFLVSAQRPLLFCLQPFCGSAQLEGRVLLTQKSQCYADCRFIFFGKRFSCYLHPLFTCCSLLCGSFLLFTKFWFRKRVSMLPIRSHRASALHVFNLHTGLIEWGTDIFNVNLTMRYKLFLDAQ